MDYKPKQPFYQQSNQPNVKPTTRSIHTIRISGFSTEGKKQQWNTNETQKAFKRLQFILRIFPFFMILALIVIFYILFTLAGAHFPMFILIFTFTIMFIKELSTLFFSVSMRNNIMKPISELRDAVDEVAKGNYGYTLRPTHNNLLNDLVTSFNRMSLQLKEADEIKQRYERNQKELIAGISHDLKTPITSILGYVNGIQSGVADCDDKLDNYLNIIASNAEYTNQLIDELFLFSKLDINQMEYDFQNIPVKDFFSDIFVEKQLELEDKEIEMNYTMDIDDNASLFIDAKLIHRVISNLIGNAVKYSDKDHTKIDIRLSHIDASPNGILFSVKDNGKGISNDQLGKIFDVFYRADPARNKDVGGSGLGLAIARQLIVAHDGRIWVESELGEGSTFYFTLRETIDGDVEHREV